jgi:hypothetical protein
MRKRTRYSLLIALALLAVLALMVVLRKKAPPEAARLLPESDAIVYVNAKAVRTLTHLDRTPVHRSLEYQSFVDATGFVPERDLDAAAFALHRMPDPNGPNGPVAYSEVFEGRFDGVKLAAWLSAHASSTEQYAGHTVYAIPVEGRTLRVCLVGYDTIAASNTPTAEQIHAMLDRYRTAASPFSGSSLLESHFRDVPLLAPVWGIGAIALPFSESGRVSVFGLQLPLAEDTIFVASLRPEARLDAAVRLRVEQISPDAAEAARSTQSLTAILAIFRGLESQSQIVTVSDRALHQAAESLRIERQNNRVVLTATLPVEMLRALTGSAASH